MSAVILAGGLGTRLRSSVPDLPKPLAPVAGRPFLSHLLDRLADAGLSEVTLAVGYRGELIEAHYGRSYRGIDLRYSWEKEPLGTGGALVQALRQMDTPDQPVWVFNGDTLLTFDLSKAAAFYREKQAECLILLKELYDFDRYGIVATDEEDRVVAFVEKAPRQHGWINGGVYLLDPQVLLSQAFPKRFSLEKDFMEAQLTQLRCYAYRETDYFIDIGIPADYARAQRELQ